MSGGCNCYGGILLCAKHAVHDTCRYASGNEYEGEWVAGEKHGQGKMKWLAEKMEYSGQWEKGVPVRPQ